MAFMYNWLLGVECGLLVSSSNMLRNLKAFLGAVVISIMPIFINVSFYIYF